MLKLVGTDGRRFYSWMLEPGKYKIGRDRECDFHIPHKTVSMKHAELEVSADSERCFLVDLGSRNGTFVNNERITRPTQIGVNDTIMLAHAEFRLVSADAPDKSPSGMDRATLSEHDPKSSVFLSIDEALKPLPKKVTEVPELLPTIFEMAKTQVLSEPREAMLRRSLKMISRIIPSERLAILFVDEAGGDVYTVATHLSGSKDPGGFTLSRTIVNEIITNKKSILICDPREDPRFTEQKSIIMSGLKSAIAVPLFDEGRVLGILYADTTIPAHQYSDDHLKVLATFGNIIASRLLNYELLAERQEKQIIEAELRQAASIQKNLLVSSSLDILGYDVYAFQEPCRSVGGDLYDMEILPDGRLFFLLADVSGKGLGAALLMSNLLASFRILYESREPRLCRIVERVSLQMNRHSAPGSFATLFIGLLEPGEGRISFVNAGHNPPLLVRADGTIKHLEASGFMIGAFDFGDWKEETVVLSEGNLLFIFSDGVTEAERGGEQYGDDRMERLVISSGRQKSKEIIARVISDINDFLGDEPRSDDITILSLKRNMK
jgi:serine phosphatase RsbU (regulator of sigma subunit)